MKSTIIYILLFSSLLLRSQSIKIGGVYSMGELPEKKGGILYLYPNSDTSFLFYLELGRGAPSFGSGAIVGKIDLKTDKKGYFEKHDTRTLINCAFSVIFHKDSLEIVTTDEPNECGYGFGVYSQGIYTRKTPDIPEYFVDRLGKKTYFKDLNIETWSE